MKIAYILFNDITLLDFIGVYDAVLRLKNMNYIPELRWDLCAAGFLKNKKATTHFDNYEILKQYCKEVVKDRVVEDGKGEWITGDNDQLPIFSE